MSNECDRSPTYLSYMLRLWQAGSRGGNRSGVLRWKTRTPASVWPSVMRKTCLHFLRISWLIPTI